MIRLTTLYENLSYKTGLQSGHGLSYLLERDGKKIMFDTGPSPALKINAEILGVNLSNIDAIVISHGHYDHTGGIISILEENQSAAVYLKEEALQEKFKGYDKYIGVPEELRKARHRINFIREVTEIIPGVFAMPVTSISNPGDTHFKNFYIREQNKFVPDHFVDELFLAIPGKERLHIISGCSHRGITNVLSTAVAHFNSSPGTVTGGFHLLNAEEAKVARVAKAFLKNDVQRIEVSHCTGVDQYHFLRKHFPGKVFYNFCGKEVILD